jgi:hypothetical protein
MRTYQLIGTVCTVLSLSSTQAQTSQQQFHALCERQHDRVFAMLRDEFGEHPLAAARGGTDEQGGVMTLTVNPETKSWTILVITRDKTCILGGGTEFTIRPVPEKKR